MTTRIYVRWVGSEGRYKVSEPSWDGGEVVMASDYDKEHAIAEAAREFCAKCPGFSGTEIGKLYDLCSPPSGEADAG
jgi:hypothetical protein